MKNQGPNNPHDKIFKELLRQKIFAKAFIKQHVSKRKLAHLDLSTLKLWNASFVHYKRESHSDVVYRVKTKDKQDCYVVLLFEHQSTPDELQAFRVIEYEICLMRQHLDQGHKKLPVIMTSVFYHGNSSPYPYSTDIFDCFESPEIAKEYYLQPFNLIDVSQIPDEELKKNIVTAPLQIIMKHIRDNDLLPILTDLTRSGILSENATLNRGKLFSGVLEYAISIGKISDKKAFNDLLLNQPDEVRHTTMTMAEFKASFRKAAIEFYKQKAIQEGRQEGMQKGIQEGRQKGMQEGMQKGMQEGRQKGMQEGIQEGIQQGVKQAMQQVIQQNSRDIAMRMLKCGEAIQKITIYTGLSAKELEGIKSESKAVQN